MSYLNFAATSE